MPTIIATPGAANANSYATLVEADTYHTTRGHNSQWISASDETKETNLIWATRTLDANMEWYGQATNSTQALNWPRYGTADQNGYSIDQDVIPQALKDAQAELAFLLIVDDRTIADDSPDPNIKKGKIGPLEGEFFEGNKRVVLSNSVVELIQHLGVFTGVGTNKKGGVVGLIRS